MDPSGNGIVSQDEIDKLIGISDFICEEEGGHSLADEIRDALLDSGKLTLSEWRSLRDRLREIEELGPHIDFIIGLKAKEEAA